MRSLDSCVSRCIGDAGSKKRADRLNASARAAVTHARERGRAHQIEIIDEATFRSWVTFDVSGLRFAFAGGFASAPEGFEDDLLHRMVTSVGGPVQDEVDERLDIVVIGPKQAKTKAARLRAAEIRRPLRMLNRGPRRLSGASGPRVQHLLVLVIGLTRLGELSQAGVRCVGLGALGYDARPQYDRQLAGRCRKAGMDVLVCTPERLAEAMADIIRGP